MMLPGCRSRWRERRDVVNNNARVRLIGVTILELLVAVTSVTTLLSVTLPAVLSAREASRDRECQHRLGQISAALHEYHEIHGCLPAGWLTDRSGQTGYGWAAALLPEIGEDTLNAEIDWSQPVERVAERIRQTTPSLYFCPSDHGSDSFPLFDELGAPGANAQKSTRLLVTLPRANYMGVFGNKEPDEVPGNSGEGMFIEGGGVRYGDVKRGLGRVLLLGERTTRKLPSTWLGVVLSGEDAEGRIVGCAGLGPNRSDTDECEFDSRHDRHVNFAWVDGHVSGVEDDIDGAVYRQFAQRQ